MAVDEGAVLSHREWIAVAVGLGIDCTLAGRVASSRTGLVAADNADYIGWTY